MHRQVTGFAKATEAYERGRPGYPPEIADWIAEVGGLAPGRLVVDLAAGTGKLTRQLVGERRRGHRRRAARRDALGARRHSSRRAMRRRHRRGDDASERVRRRRHRRPGVPLVRTRERARRDRARAAKRRPARPRLEPPRHRANRSRPRSAGSSSPTGRARPHTPRGGGGRSWTRRPVSRSWGSCTSVHEQIVDRLGLIDRVGSISFVANLPDEVRSSALARIGELMTDEPATVSLRYTTDAYAYRPVH